MNRLSFAFRSFFSILFSGTLAPDIAQAFGYTKPMPVRAAAAAPEPSKPAPEKKQPGPNDGAVAILGAMQAEGRLIDFLMEDISGYSDDQVGAAVRDVHSKSRQALDRCMSVAPLIDGVEGDFAKTEGLSADAVKLVGNVPPGGKVPGGLLRHKGWKAEKITLATVNMSKVLAPAELEVE